MTLTITGPTNRRANFFLHFLRISRCPWLLTGDHLQDSGEHEALSLPQGEQLSHKHKQRQDGKDAGQGGGGLHYL